MTNPEEVLVSEVGRGTVLAGRYRIVAPAPSDLDGATAWQATDQILDRPVRVRVLEAGAVAPALDAARRAALVTDARLVRVLDVGTHEGVGYVVSEQVTGPSLAQLVARAPLTPDQARAVIGEAASALEVARRRGVHHLALRPSVLHVNSDGRVLLGGLAIDAALLGTAGGDARATTRSDTVGLVRLLYAALTGLWPAGDRPGAGDPLPEAPLLGARPVPPSDLVAGIPADLDTLCAVTLGPHDDGPHSPGELVRELEPWGEIRAVAGVPDATAVLGGAVAAATEPTLADIVSQDTEPVRVQRQSVRSAFDSPPPGANRPGTPPPAAPSRSSAFSAAGPGAGAAAGGPPEYVDPTVPIAPDLVGGTPTAAFAGAGAGAGAQSGADAVGTTSVLPAGGPPTAVAPPTAAPGAFASHGAPVSPAAASVPRAPVAHVPPPPGDPSGPAGTYGAAPVRRPTSAYRTDGSSGLPPVLPPDDGLESFDELGWGEPDAPERRRFDPTKLVLAVVAVAVVIGVVLAFRALFSSLDPGDTGAQPDDQTQEQPAESAAPEQPAEQPGETPAGEAPAAAAPVIASTTSFDPSDSDGEHEEAVARAYDGDPSTFWYTQTYKRDDFAGFKNAVGYVVNLQAPSTLSKVTLHVNGTGGNVEIRNTTAADPGGGTVLASGPVGPDTVFEFDPVETSTVVVWITQLPTAADGGFRLELNEMSLG
ncbi:hypothetical protein GXP71_16580 [Cellulomonas sp. H30R-01]|nr:protein kinase family protein [Cellulomonas sp. H30R-01]QHT57524.1 hypothetical protein GXP71_16580 [Cellulomonas sp. H30R-01]